VQDPALALVEPHQVALFPEKERNNESETTTTECSSGSIGLDEIHLMVLKVLPAVYHL